MGRYYNGDIEGKFWFGVQSSGDVENLVTITPHTFYSWIFCGCNAEIKDETYCHSCFQSQTEHEEAVMEENEDADLECLYMEMQSNGYSLDESTHYSELLDNMNKLKSSLNKNFINEFGKIEQNEKILDAFSGVFNNACSIIDDMKFENDKEAKKVCELAARYTLGYQIEYCIRTTGSCNILCEY
jgi:hypothetical protein